LEERGDGRAKYREDHLENCHGADQLNRNDATTPAGNESAVHSFISSANRFLVFLILVRAACTTYG
jgi:hypothetical protein